MSRFFFILAMSTVFLTPVSTQEKESSLTQYYDTELFRINFKMFDGLSIEYQGISASAMFGLPNNFKDALIQYKDVGDYIDSYSNLNFAGNVFLWGGLTAVLVGAYYPMLNSSSSNGYTTENIKMALGIMIGGLVSEIIGAILLPAGYNQLTNGINLYNRHKIKEYK